MDETLGLALLLQQTAAPSGTSVLVSYIPILMMLAMAGGLAAILLTTSRLIGQMVDVLIPTTDGRQLRLSRYTQPEAEHSILQQQLRLCLPEQPQPKISATLARKHARQAVPV